MSSIPYPQMVQNLQMQATEMGTMHESSLPAPLATSILSDLNAAPHFYQEFIRQSPITDGYGLNHASNQLVQSDNITARSMQNEAKPVEII